MCAAALPFLLIGPLLSVPARPLATTTHNMAMVALCVGVLSMTMNVALSFIYSLLVDCQETSVPQIAITCETILNANRAVTTAESVGLLLAGASASTVYLLYFFVADAIPSRCSQSEHRISVFLRLWFSLKRQKPVGMVTLASVPCPNDRQPAATIIITSRHLPLIVSRRRGKLLSHSDQGKIVDAYAASRRRLILLDYDGTLVPFIADPNDAVPPAGLVSLLKSLCVSFKNHVVLISGRKRDDLVAWFGSLRMTLVAEHGTWVRPTGSCQWQATTRLDNRWKDLVRPVFRQFTDRIEGSITEEKEASMAWHYRRVDLNAGAVASRKLTKALRGLAANSDLGVTNENRVVEIRSSRVSKGSFFQSYLSHEPWDFILAVGDDTTDETLFSVLPSSSYSIRIGRVASAARFNLGSADAVVGLLEGLTAEDRLRHTHP